jgi:hypothetical protein
MGANAETLGLFDISARSGSGGQIAILLEFRMKLARTGQVELHSPALYRDRRLSQAQHAMRYK